MLPQRILVTGGAGFIGSHTVQMLLDQNHQVVVLDNLSSGKLDNLPLNHPHLEFVEGDILEYPLLQDLLINCDAVLHLAALSSVPQTIANPIYSFQVNTQGLLHVLEAVRQSGRSIRVVYASSAAVYGNVLSLPCTDVEPLVELPLSPYALQKKHDEDYAGLYTNLHQIKSLGLRYFNVYGERQDPNSPYSGVISRFLDAYRQGGQLTVFGDGLQSRDFIHVSDIAKANCLALQSDYAGAINIATGQPSTLLEMIKCIEKAGEKEADIQFAPARAGDIRASYATTELARIQLAFESSVTLEQGMARLVKMG